MAQVVQSCCLMIERSWLYAPNPDCSQCFDFALFAVSSQFEAQKSNCRKIMINWIARNWNKHSSRTAQLFSRLPEPMSHFMWVCLGSWAYYAMCMCIECVRFELFHYIVRYIYRYYVPYVIYFTLHFHISRSKSVHAVKGTGRLCEATLLRGEGLVLRLVFVGVSSIKCQTLLPNCANQFLRKVYAFLSWCHIYWFWVECCQLKSNLPVVALNWAYEAMKYDKETFFSLGDGRANKQNTSAKSKLCFQTVLRRPYQDKGHKEPILIQKISQLTDSEANMRMPTPKDQEECLELPLTLNSIKNYEFNIQVLQDMHNYSFKFIMFITPIISHPAWWSRQAESRPLTGHMPLFFWLWILCLPVILFFAKLSQTNISVDLGFFSKGSAKVFLYLMLIMH